MNVLIRGDLFSVRHDVVFSEKTGRGYRYPNVPAQMMENSASFVRYETKMSRQETSYAASCGAIRMKRKQESAEAIVAQMKRPVRTGMQGVVGRAGEKPALTRLCLDFIYG